MVRAIFMFQDIPGITTEREDIRTNMYLGSRSGLFWESGYRSFAVTWFFQQETETLISIQMDPVFFQTIGSSYPLLQNSIIASTKKLVFRRVWVWPSMESSFLQILPTL